MSIVGVELLFDVVLLQTTMDDTRFFGVLLTAKAEGEWPSPR